MVDLCRLILWAVVGLFRSRRALQAEILVLRHQLNVLRRRSPERVAVGNIDRLVFAGLYRLAPEVLDALKILKPETVIRWHRAGFRTWWRWKSRPRGGRPKVTDETRQLIREMSVANPLWGAPRIHGELLKLGIDVGQTTVAKYMARRRRPPSQGLSLQSRRCDRLDRHVRRTDYLVSTTVRASDPATFATGASVGGRDSSPQRRVAVPATDRGLWLDRAATLYHSRPRRRLWRYIHPTPWSDGHTGSTDLGAVAMAERVCGEAGRVGPAGLP
jgi:hypothetical protein